MPITLAMAWLALGVSVAQAQGGAASDAARSGQASPSSATSAPTSAATSAPASATVPSSGASAQVAASVPSGPPPRRWMNGPRVFGRITAKDLGVVINQDDPYSVQVGEHYVRARQIPPEHVLRVNLPVKGTLNQAEFEALRRQVDTFFGDKVQGLALVWRLPYAVDCQSLTGALTLGFDPQLCNNTCGAGRTSRYFGAATSRPFKDLGLRPSMMLAARDADSAKALIDRGVRADHTLGLRGGLPANVHYVITSDSVRSVRQALYPPEGKVPRLGIDVSIDETEALRGADRVLLYMTGRTHVDALDTVQFLPGALADHLTSFGGMLDKPHGQMTVMAWIQAGATATYGTVSEPCAHLQKFPHPQALLMFYVQGASALEAYWKSVAWPQQGLFVGEPLSAPFAR